MTDDQITTGVPAVVSPRERAQAVARALGDAARRARFSSRHRGKMKGVGLRAQRNAQVFKLVRLISFIAIVVIPVLTVACYYAFIASDQYVSEVRFTVRGGMPPKLDGIGALTGAPSALIIQDTQIVMSYLQSRTMLEDLEKKIDLRRYYTSDDIDWFSRLKSNAKIEKFVRYWKGMTGMTVEMPAGIVIFTVHAFDPKAAAHIADEAIEASEILINKMNDQMIKDTVALAEVERQKAEDNLAKARADLERARNEEGVLSADKSAEGINTVMTTVRAELAKLQQDYETQRRYVTEDSPQIRNIKAKITAANDEIAKLQALMTRGPNAVGGSSAGDNALSGTMSRLDTLNLENLVAEKMYATSLALVANASIASETKLMYLETFVRPVPAQEARYPHRVVNTIIFTLGAFAAWGAFIGLFAFARSKMS